MLYEVITVAHAPVPYHGQVDRAGQLDRAAGSRITSYNVCYTKLLRAGRAGRLPDSLQPDHDGDRRTMMRSASPLLIGLSAVMVAIQDDMPLVLVTLV